MRGPTALERAAADLAEGRPWKARDRLQGLVLQQPWNQRALEMLARICFDMGDHPRAGLYWFLTAHHGPDVDTAFDAMYERYSNDPRVLLQHLPLKHVDERLPDEVVARLEAMGAAVRTRAIDQARAFQDPLRESLPARIIGGIAFVLIAALTVGTWILGLVESFARFGGWVALAIAAALLLTVGVEAMSRRRLRRAGFDHRSGG